MFNRITVIVALLVPFAVQAAEPDLKPGLWEYDTRIVVESDFPIPDQRETSTDCLTQEKLDEHDLMQDFGEACEVIQQDIRRDGMDFTVRCDQEGYQANMNGVMKFNGERAEGTINMQVESPIGLMAMRMEMTGSRIGDCE